MGTYNWVEQASWVAGIISLPLSVIFLVQALRMSRQRLEESQEDPSEALEDRIRRATESFAETGRLLAELQNTFSVQQAALKKVTEEAEEQALLRDMDPETAEKMRRIIVGETKATLRAERRTQRLYFAGGVLLSIPIGALINWLVP
ncbi:hypothetical protein GCM10009733_026260 [Nonomuraea maheshkhaliensis]|uniref:DUF106 domain-containing protein n=1 Tax=Nonomuraea maheshkhaliensis TaxID=419590 RepID=A0ABN2F2W7_9ACTN